MTLREAALVAGIGYLVSFVFSLGNTRRDKLVVRGDAAATASNIRASESRFRVGIATWVVTLTADLVVAWASFPTLHREWPFTSSGGRYITALMGGRAAGVGCSQDIRNLPIDESAHSLEGVGYWPGYTLHLVDYEIKTIEREELKTKLDRGDNFKLLMAMHEWGFRVAHIPGSMHFNTVEEAREGLDLDDEIVVYCTDPACVASQFAYRWLIESGYTNVRRYEGGVSDWAAAGYELESDPASDSSEGVFFLPNRPTAGS